MVQICVEESEVVSKDDYLIVFYKEDLLKDVPLVLVFSGKENLRLSFLIPLRVFVFTCDLDYSTGPPGGILCETQENGLIRVSWLFANVHSHGVASPPVTLASSANDFNRLNKIIWTSVVEEIECSFIGAYNRSLTRTADLDTLFRIYLSEIIETRVDDEF